MKDGTVYKGKILIDGDKAILIGNPPFDPDSYLLESDDIEKIVYEEYKQKPPAERKRGLTFETRLSGNVFSSDQLSLNAAPGLFGGVGFRVHPLLELNGGLDWLPALHSGSGLSVSDGTTTRKYKDFWMYSGVVGGRAYPFHRKSWKTEPYLWGGYSWSHLAPKASGDSLTGSGWQVGFGALRGIDTHLFLEGRLTYGTSSFGSISFLGNQGSIQPKISENQVQFSTGLSYRL